MFFWVAQICDLISLQLIIGPKFVIALNLLWPSIFHALNLLSESVILRFDQDKSKCQHSANICMFQKGQYQIQAINLKLQTKMKHNSDDEQYIDQSFDNTNNFESLHANQPLQMISPLLYQQVKNLTQLDPIQGLSNIRHISNNRISQTAQTTGSYKINPNQLHINYLNNNVPKEIPQPKQIKHIKLIDTCENPISTFQQTPTDISRNHINSSQFKRFSANSQRTVNKQAVFNNQRRSLHLIPGNKNGKNTPSNNPKIRTRKPNSNYSRYDQQNNHRKYDAHNNTYEKQAEYTADNRQGKRRQKVSSLKDVFQKLSLSVNKGWTNQKSINQTQIKDDLVYQQPQRNQKRQVVFIKTYILSSFQSISIQISLLNKSIIIMGYLIGQSKDALKLILSPQKSQNLLEESFYDYQIIGKRIYIQNTQGGYKHLKIGPLSSMFSPIQEKQAQNQIKRQSYSIKLKEIKEKKNQELHLRQKQFINRNYYSILSKDTSIFNTLQNSDKAKQKQDTINNAQNIHDFTFDQQNTKNAQNQKDDTLKTNKMSLVQVQKHLQRHSKHIDYMSAQMRLKIKQMNTQKQIQGQNNTQKSEQKKLNMQIMAKKQFLAIQRLSKPKQILTQKSKQKPVIRTKNKSTGKGIKINKKPSETPFVQNEQNEQRDNYDKNFQKGYKKQQKKLEDAKSSIPNRRKLIEKVSQNNQANISNLIDAHLIDEDAKANDADKQFRDNTANVDIEPLRQVIIVNLQKNSKSSVEMGQNQEQQSYCQFEQQKQAVQITNQAKYRKTQQQLQEQEQQYPYQDNQYEKESSEQAEKEKENTIDNYQEQYEVEQSNQNPIQEQKSQMQMSTDRYQQDYEQQKAQIKKSTDKKQQDYDEQYYEDQQPEQYPKKVQHTQFKQIEQNQRQSKSQSEEQYLREDLQDSNQSPNQIQDIYEDEFSQQT